MMYRVVTITTKNEIAEQTRIAAPLDELVTIYRTRFDRHTSHFDFYYLEGDDWGSWQGMLVRDGFVAPDRVVSHGPRQPHRKERV
jgi:hypothetical protein